VSKKRRRLVAPRRGLDINALASVLYDIAMRLAADARAIVRMPSKQQALALQQRRVLEEHQQRVFEACGGNQSLAADILGVHRRTFQRRMSGASRTFQQPRKKGLKPLIRRPRSKRAGKYNRIDAARVAQLRAEHVSWPEIADELGCSETGAWRAFKRARSKR
jgi:predicted DNA-binding protein (UPF0251 family)